MGHETERVVLGRLHLVADCAAPLGAIEGAVRGGVDVVHLRDHGASAAQLLSRGRELRSVLRRDARLVVNDRVDVALALAADGVQLGGRSLPVDETRRIAPGMPIGVSIHRVEETELSADWLLLGTIFASGSHPGQPGAGVALIRRAAVAARAPIIAIGGIDASNAASCVAAGAHGVAVISAILAAADPRAAAEWLREEVERA